MKRLAIIPARGGSKRLPKKNIRDFCGKPMIGHILDTARASGLFDEIHVSTDSEEIRDVATGMGFEPAFPRPAELADDHTPIMPVLKYVAETYQAQGYAFEQIWLLMACSPLIEAQDLIEAAAVSVKHNNQKAVISVAPYPVPIEWAFIQNDDRSLTPVQPGMFAVRSQDLSLKYYDTGSFEVFPAHLVLQSEGAGTDTDYLGHVLPKEKVVDIDTEQDWALAETLYRGKVNTTHSM